MNAVPRRFFVAFAFCATVAFGQLQPSRELRSRGETLTPISLATADFDVDGYPDLAVGYAEGRVSVYFGNKYAFTHTGVADPFRDDVLTIDVPVRPDFLATGDFDGDLRPDLAVAARGDRAFYVLISGKGAPWRAAMPSDFTSTAIPMRLGVDARPGMATIALDHRFPLIAQPLSAVTFIVDGFTDSTGACDGAHHCPSLRSAVIAANANAGADTIQLGNGTYVLSIPGDDISANLGDLDVTDSVTIVGNGAANTTITTTYDASCDTCRVFHWNPFATTGLTIGISGVTISNGWQNERGGGIYGYMTGITHFSISDCVITGNHATGNGGGVYIEGFVEAGDVTISNTTVSSNASGGSTGGGGIYLSGQGHAVTLTNTKVIGNSSQGGGGGIYYNNTTNSSTLTITGASIDPATPCTSSPSAICNNTASGSAGGLYVNGASSVMVDHTKISGNSALSVTGQGGGVSTYAAQFTGTLLEITGNHADGGNGHGGGLYSATPAVFLSASTISNNTAHNGGGIAQYGGTLDFHDGAISGNTSVSTGGGIDWGGSQLTVTRVNIVGNTSTNSSGAAIYATGKAFPAYCRIVNNNGQGPIGTVMSGAAIGSQANDNWWGANTVTPFQLAPSIAATNTLVLHALAGSSAICAGDTTSLTATFAHDSGGADVSAQLGAFIGLPVTFDGGALGIVDSTTGAIVSGGTATTTFTAGPAGGVAQPSVTVDGFNIGTSITIQGVPSLTSSFLPSSVPPNGTSTLSYAMQNATGSAITNVHFTDTLPSGLQVAAVPNIVSACGSLSASAGSGTVTFNGGTIPANSTCTVKVDVTAVTEGAKNDATTIYGASCSGVTAMSTLSVATPLQGSAVFGDASMTLSGGTLLQFTITNPNGTTSLTGVAFDDTLPAGLVFSSPSGNLCGGQPTTFDATSVHLADATLAPGATCTFSMAIAATSAGHKVNTFSLFFDGGSGTVPAPSAIDVVAPPDFTKSFSKASLPIGGAAILTFHLTNSNGVALNDVAFADNFTNGLIVDTPNGIDNQCGGTFTSGSSSVSLSGASLGAGASCTISVRVSATTVGTVNNVTDPVTSSNGGQGSTASASIVANSCTYLISAPSIQFDASAHGGSVGVTTTAACSWDAISSASWLVATSSGTGNGTVTYSVAANAFSPQRQATLRIGNQTFTVTQDGVQPFGLSAGALTNHEIKIMWSSPPTNGHFEIWRNDGASPTLAPLAGGTTTATSFIDGTVQLDHAYVYAVRAVDVDGVPSALSNRDLAVMAFFTNDPLVAQFSPIRLSDLTDVRRVIDVVRSSAGLGGYAWTDVSGSPVYITAAQVNQFKAALFAVSAAFGIPDYDPPDVTAGSPIDAARFNTLHEFLK